MSKQTHAGEQHEARNTPGGGNRESAQPATTPRTPVTVAALLDGRTPFDPQISPDGARIAFTMMQRRPDQQKAQSSLWWVETAGAEINDARPI
ncbi:MAG TPA: hypothetical protein VKQ36_13235, partial [Ktedonobacterales bacterium]|nr:hypothetical protein [Ktedonobacterales bacterium]